MIPDLRALTAHVPRKQLDITTAVPLPNIKLDMKMKEIILVVIMMTS